MDRQTIFELKEQLQSRGYFIEVMTERYFVLSKLKDNDGKLYYAYNGVYDSDGKIKIFDFNIK